MFIKLFIDVCYLVSGVFWIADTDVCFLRLAGDSAGDVAMSFVGCFKYSEVKKRIYLLFLLKNLTRYFSDT